LPQIEAFAANYGLTQFDYWRDDQSNFMELLPSEGGRMFPLQVVIDGKGIVRLLENSYVPGEAIEALEKAVQGN
jgi:hypothetical protein